MKLRSKCLGLFLLVRLRWVRAKSGEEIRVFQEGETHLKRQRDFTGSRESTSATISAGRIAQWEQSLFLLPLDILAVLQD